MDTGFHPIAKAGAKNTCSRWGREGSLLGRCLRMLRSRTEGHVAHVGDLHDLGGRLRAPEALVPPERARPAARLAGQDEGRDRIVGEQELDVEVERLADA